MKRVFIILLAATACAAASPDVDKNKVILGKWKVENPRRAPRIVFFHANHTWGVTNFDPDKPEEINGRRWRIEDGRLILTYPTVDNGRHGFQTSAYTIVSFRRDRFETDVFTYTRIK
jgi:hypothetical protein